MKITTIQLLWDAVPQGIRDHEHTMDGQLPSASIYNLQREMFQMLKDQATESGLFKYSDNNNHVPAHYGCGLFCRFMFEAIKAGHELDFGGLEVHAY